MKQLIEKSSILTIALIVSIGATTACSSFTDKINNRREEIGSAGNASPVNNKTNAENKAVANKPATENTQADSIEIYDGRKSISEVKTTEPTNADEELVTKEFKDKESFIRPKFGDAYCEESEANDIGITGIGSGSFTKPNFLQKAYLYTVCSSGSSQFGVGGIMIFEDGKIVSHYVYGENGVINGGLFILPDINKNGVAELVLMDGQMHQGYGGESIVITEFKDGNLNVIGGTPVSSDNSGAAEDDAKVEAEAHKISVQPSANPVFFQEIYEQKGNAKNWTLTKKSAKFSLKKDVFGKNYKIS